jgi:hypothetical protein
MNNPRMRIKVAAVKPFRSEQTLPTRPVQLVPGTVLLATFSPPQDQSCGARLSGYCSFLVKNVRISLFNLVFTQVFTLSPPKVLTGRNMLRRNFKSSGRKTTKTGGSDPTFSAFSRPKSAWGRSRPIGPMPARCMLP